MSYVDNKVNYASEVRPDTGARIDTFERISFTCVLDPSRRKRLQ
jgi:hypothetical protein